MDIALPNRLVPGKSYPSYQRQLMGRVPTAVPQGHCCLPACFLSYFSLARHQHTNNSTVSSVQCDSGTSTNMIFMKEIEHQQSYIIHTPVCQWTCEKKKPACLQERKLNIYNKVNVNNWQQISYTMHGTNSLLQPDTGCWSCHTVTYTWHQAVIWSHDCRRFTREVQNQQEWCCCHLYNDAYTAGAYHTARLGWANTWPTSPKLLHYRNWLS